jgi:hypothetical protein
MRPSRGGASEGAGPDFEILEAAAITDFAAPETGRTPWFLSQFQRFLRFLL